MPSLQRRTLAQLPGPKGLPIIGNLLQIDLKRLHLILEDWAAIYGAVYQFKLVNRPVVAISDPELIQMILRDRPHTYRRMSAIERVANELGMTGVFSAEGDAWQRQRRLTMQAFNPNHLRQFYPSLRKITERLKARWDRVASSQQVLDVQKDWRRFTVDVTTHLAFGYDMNTLERKDDVLQSHLEKLFPAFNRRVNAPFPFWHYVKLPGDRALDKSLSVIRETINEFIQLSRERLAKQPELTLHPTNFLEALLTAHDEGVARFTDEEIVGNVMTILIGGEDTTAHTLSWMMYLLTEYPDALRKIQQEADTVLGVEQVPQDISSLEKLSYIEAVTHEAMRLKPVVPLLFIEPNQDVNIGGISIPKGTTLMLVMRYGALQEENFTTGREFRPERWLNPASAGCAHNRNAITTFGAGPRFCPGRNLALLEIKTAMAMVCRNFTMTRVDTTQPVEEIFSFTMMPKNLRVKLNAR